MTPDLEALVPYLIQRLGALQLDLLAAQWQVEQQARRIAELEAAPDAADQ